MRNPRDAGRAFNESETDVREAFREFTPEERIAKLREREKLIQETWQEIKE